MAKKWLQERFESLFSALSVCTSEEEVARYCVAELDAWRARGLSENSMRVPMTDTRAEMNKRLTGDVLTWSLKHLNFSEEQWAAMNAPSQQAQAKRLEDVQFIAEPDAIVARAVELLASQRWQDIAVGLLALTGRRLGEVLKTGVFVKQSAFTVMFSGQLKKRNADFPAYEIPTLCESDLVIDATQRLRTLLDLSTMSISNVSPTYNKDIAACASQHFAELIPAENGRIHAHIFRSVYTRIAVLYFCPRKVADLHFLAYTQGHFEIGGKEEVLRSYATEMNYNHYKIADRDGNVDGRLGLKLGVAGVDVLRVLQPGQGHSSASTDTKKGIVKSAAAAETVAADEKPATAPKYTNIRVSAETRERFDRVGKQLLQVESLDRQLDTVVSTLLDLVENAMNYADNPSAQSPVRVIPEQFVDTETAQLIHTTMDASKEDFITFLSTALTKEARFRHGVTMRYAGKDFTTMSSEELQGVKHPGALEERVKRAIAAIDAHNAKVTPLERWYVNPSSVAQLTGGRLANIAAYFAAHQAEIDAINARFDLTTKYNHKPLKIRACVTVE